MHGSLQRRIEEANETERQLRQGTDKIVSVRDFGIVAKALWPLKTAAHIAAIGRADERTAARWISGEFPPPAIVITAIMVRITNWEAPASITDAGKSRGRNAQVDSGRGSAPP